MAELNCIKFLFVLFRYCTDEVLLREMGEDPFLQRYNFVIIDEFQERTVATPTGNTQRLYTRPSFA